jgi:uncharacterized phage protein (TIGR02220 family)
VLFYQGKWLIDMARSRNIKPGLFKNEILGVADPVFTIVFTGLWTLADREGRLEDRPLRIKTETIPYRDNIDINSVLNWLYDKKFIIRYSVNGDEYIQIVNFKKHQNPHKNEIESSIPKYIQQDETVPIKSEEVPSNSVALRLIPDSFNLDSRMEADASCRAEQPTRPRATFPISEIVSFLNEKSMRDFKESTKSTRKHIAARCKEGASVADFKAVISHKVDEWGTDPAMMSYIRPETLFGTKFEAYLQAAKAAGYFDNQGTFSVVLPTDYKPPGGFECSTNTRQ